MGFKDLGFLRFLGTGAWAPQGPAAKWAQLVVCPAPGLPHIRSLMHRSACCRGGSARGRSWWEAGRRTKSQNSFDDFAACADYLVDSGITSPNRLAIVVCACYAVARFNCCYAELKKQCHCCEMSQEQYCRA